MKQTCEFQHVLFCACYAYTDCICSQGHYLYQENDEFKLKESGHIPFIFLSARIDFRPEELLFCFFCFILLHNFSISEMLQNDDSETWIEKN